MIRKRGNKWCVISHTTGRNLGCYSSKIAAEKRLKQIRWFKYQGKSKRKPK